VELKIPFISKRVNSRRSGSSPGCVGLLLSLLALGGCAPSDDAGYISECVVEADQSRTFMGRWRNAPIYLAFRDGHFNSYETELMMNAADVWNNFFLATQGFQVFDYGSRQVPRVTTRNKPSGGICGQSIVSSGGGYSGAVVLYKQVTWPYPSQPGAIAITTVCTNPGVNGVIPPMYNAMLELNYENFFVTGKQVPDMTTLIVHELGHLLGLDHSCSTSNDSSSATRPPSCSSSNLNYLYYEAVMYPTVSFSASGEGMIRRSVNHNDQGRANCLYGSSAK
jgi:hypothetical protein